MSDRVRVKAEDSLVDRHMSPICYLTPTEFRHAVIRRTAAHALILDRVYLGDT